MTRLFTRLFAPFTSSNCSSTNLASVEDHEVLSQDNPMDGSLGKKSIFSILLFIGIIFAGLAQNTPPTAADFTVAVGLDGYYVITVADLGFNDHDGDILNSVEITTLPGTGVLFLEPSGIHIQNGVYDAGEEVTAGDVIFLNELAANRLMYQGDDTHGSTTFTFTVNDGVDPADAANTATLWSVDNALDFDGVNDFVDLGTKASLQPANGLTAEVWVYKDDWASISSHQTIIGNTQLVGSPSVGSPSGGLPLDEGGYSIDLLTSNNVQGAVYRNLSYGTVTFSTAGLSAGWHHIALTYDGTLTTLYVDAMLVDQDDAGTPYEIEYLNGVSVYIGRQFSGTDYFDGRVDEMRIWNNARTLTEIRDNADSGYANPLGESSLVGYYDFNTAVPSGSNATEFIVTDLSLQANHGTLNNGSGDAGVSGFLLTGATSNWVASTAIATATTGNIVVTQSSTVYPSNGTDYDFGTQPLATNTDVIFQIENQGWASFDLDGVPSVPSNYSLVAAYSPPITLAPGQSQALTVRFTPSTNAMHAGDVIIPNNIGADYALGVTGVGDLLLPIYFDVTWLDDGDGTIDEMQVTFNEDVSFTDNAPGNDFAFDALTLSTGSITETMADWSSVNGVTTYTFDVTGIPAGTGDPGITVTYNDGAENTIVTHSSGKSLGSGATQRTTTDGAAPIIIGATTVDSQPDGFIEAVILEFSESLDDGHPNGTISQLDVDGYTGDATTSVTGDDEFLTVTFTQKLAPNYDTDATPDVNMPASTVSDAAGNVLGSPQSFTSTDGASPAIVAVKTGDIDRNGELDFVDIYFSEDIDDGASTDLDGFDVNNLAVHNYANEVGDTNDNNDNALTVSFDENAGVPDTGETPQVTMAVNSVSDGISNNTSLQLFTGTEDFAIPVIYDPGNSAEVAGNNRYFQVVFSEPIQENGNDGGDGLLTEDDFTISIDDTGGANPTITVTGITDNLGDPSPASSDTLLFILSVTPNFYDANSTDHDIEVAVTAAGDVTDISANENEAITANTTGALAFHDFTELSATLTPGTGNAWMTVTFAEEVSRHGSIDDRVIRLARSQSDGDIQKYHWNNGSSGSGGGDELGFTYDRGRDYFGRNSSTADIQDNNNKDIGWYRGTGNPPINQIADDENVEIARYHLRLNDVDNTPFTGTESYTIYLNAGQIRGTTSDAQFTETSIGYFLDQTAEDFTNDAIVYVVDIGNDGSIDEVVVVLSDDVIDATVDLTEFNMNGTTNYPTALSGVPTNTFAATTIGGVAIGNDDPNDNILSFNFTGLGTGITDGGTFKYTGSTLTDDAGNVVIAGSVNVIDDVPPVVLTAESVDANNNGKVDQVVITLSEDVTDVSTDDFIMNTSGYSFTGVAEANGVITLDVAEIASGFDSGVILNMTIRTNRIFDINPDNPNTPHNGISGAGGSFNVDDKVGPFAQLLDSDATADAAGYYTDYPVTEGSLTFTMYGTVDDIGGLVFVEIDGNGLLASVDAGGNWRVNGRVSDKGLYDVNITTFDSNGNIRYDNTTNEINVDGGLNIDLAYAPSLVCIDADYVTLDDLVFEETDNGNFGVQTGTFMLIQLPDNFFFDTDVLPTVSDDNEVPYTTSEVQIVPSFIGNAILQLTVNVGAVAQDNHIRISGLKVTSTGDIADEAQPMTRTAGDATVFGAGNGTIFGTMKDAPTPDVIKEIGVLKPVRREINSTIAFNAINGGGTVNWYDVNGNNIYVGATPSEADFAENTTLDHDGGASNFIVGETITGQTFGATGVVSSNNGTNMVVNKVSGYFSDGEIIVGSRGGGTANISNVNSGFDNGIPGLYKFFVSENTVNCESEWGAFKVLIHDFDDPTIMGLDQSFTSRTYNLTDEMDDIYVSNPDGHTVTVTSTGSGLSIPDGTANPLLIQFTPRNAGVGISTITYQITNNTTGDNLKLDRTFTVQASSGLFTTSPITDNCSDSSTRLSVVSNDGGTPFTDPRVSTPAFPYLLHMIADGINSDNSYKIDGGDLHHNDQTGETSAPDGTITDTYQLDFDAADFTIPEGEFENVHIYTIIVDNNGTQRLGAEEYVTIYADPYVELLNISNGDVFCSDEVAFNIKHDLKYVRTMNGDDANPIADYSGNIYNNNINQDYSIHRSRNSGRTYTQLIGTFSTTTFDPSDPDQDATVEADDYGFFQITYSTGNLGPNNCSTTITRTFEIREQPAMLDLSTETQTDGGSIGFVNTDEYLIEFCQFSNADGFTLPGGGVNSITGVLASWSGSDFNALGNYFYCYRGAEYIGHGYIEGAVTPGTTNINITFDEDRLDADLQNGDVLSIFDHSNDSYGHYTLTTFTEDIIAANVTWYDEDKQHIPLLDNLSFVKPQDFGVNVSNGNYGADETVAFYFSTTNAGCESELRKVTLEVYSQAESAVIDLTERDPDWSASVQSDANYQFDYCVALVTLIHDGVATDFLDGERITGGTSGATGTVNISGDKLSLTNVVGTFQDKEVITGPSGAANLEAIEGGSTTPEPFHLDISDPLIGSDVYSVTDHKIHDPANGIDQDRIIGLPVTSTVGFEVGETIQEPGAAEVTIYAIYNDYLFVLEKSGGSYSAFSDTETVHGLSSGALTTMTDNFVTTYMLEGNQLDILPLYSGDPSQNSEQSIVIQKVQNINGSSDFAGCSGDNTTVVIRGYTEEVAPISADFSYAGDYTADMTFHTAEGTIMDEIFHTFSSGEDNYTWYGDDGKLDDIAVFTTPTQSMSQVTLNSSAVADANSRIPIQGGLLGDNNDDAQNDDYVYYVAKTDDVQSSRSFDGCESLTGEVTVTVHAKQAAPSILSDNSAGSVSLPSAFLDINKDIIPGNDDPEVDYYYAVCLDQVESDLMLTSSQGIFAYYSSLAGGSFIEGEEVIGAGASAYITTDDSGELMLRDITGTFTPGEELTGVTSGATATLDATHSYGGSSSKYEWYSHSGSTRQGLLFTGESPSFVNLQLSSISTATDRYFEVVQVTDDDVFEGVESESVLVRIGFFELDFLTFTSVSDDEDLCYDDTGDGAGNIQMALESDGGPASGTLLSYSVTSFPTDFADTFISDDTGGDGDGTGSPIIDLDDWHAKAGGLSVGGQITTHQITMEYFQSNGGCLISNSITINIHPDPDITFMYDDNNNGTSDADPEALELCYNGDGLMLEGIDNERLIIYNTLAGGSFSAGQTITGGTSSATATIRRLVTAVKSPIVPALEVYDVIGTFEVAETISNGGGVTAVVKGQGSSSLSESGNFTVTPNRGLGNTVNNAVTFDPSAAHSSPFVGRAEYVVRFNYTDEYGCTYAVDKKIYVNPIPETEGSTNDEIVFTQICKNEPIVATVPMVGLDTYENYVFTWTLPGDASEISDFTGTRICDMNGQVLVTVGASDTTIANQVTFKTANIDFDIEVEVTNPAGCSIILEESHEQQALPDLDIGGIVDNQEFCADGIDPVLTFIDNQRGATVIDTKNVDSWIIESYKESDVTVMNPTPWTTNTEDKDGGSFPTADLSALHVSAGGKKYNSKLKSIGGDITYHRVTINYTDPNRTYQDNISTCSTSYSERFIVNPNPDVTFTVAGNDALAGGFTGTNDEFCYDHGDITLKGSFADLSGLDNPSGGQFRIVVGLDDDASTETDDITLATFNNEAVFNTVSRHDLTHAIVDARYYNKSSYPVQFEYTDSEGCSHFVEQTIYVNPLPEAAAIGTGLTSEKDDLIRFKEFCNDGSATEMFINLYGPTDADPASTELTMLSDYKDYSFSWSINGGARSVVADDNTFTATFTATELAIDVIITDPNGCQTTVSENHTKQALPDLDIRGIVDNQEFCVNDSDPVLTFIDKQGGDTKINTANVDSWSIDSYNSDDLTPKQIDNGTFSFPSIDLSALHVNAGGTQLTGEESIGGPITYHTISITYTDPTRKYQGSVTTCPQTYQETIVINPNLDITFFVAGNDALAVGFTGTNDEFCYQDGDIRLEGFFAGGSGLDNPTGGSFVVVIGEDDDESSENDDVLLSTFNNVAIFNTTVRHDFRHSGSSAPEYELRTEYLVQFEYQDAEGCSRMVKQTIYINPEPEVLPVDKSPEAGDLIRFRRICDDDKTTEMEVILIDPDDGTSELSDYTDYSFLWNINGTGDVQVDNDNTYSVSTDGSNISIEVTINDPKKCSTVHFESHTKEPLPSLSIPEIADFESFCADEVDVAPSLSLTDANRDPSGIVDYTDIVTWSVYGYETDRMDTVTQAADATWTEVILIKTGKGNMPKIDINGWHGSVVGTSLFDVTKYIGGNSTVHTIYITYKDPTRKYQGISTSCENNIYETIMIHPAPDITFTVEKDETVYNIVDNEVSFYDDVITEVVTSANHFCYDDDAVDLKGLFGSDMNKNATPGSGDGAFSGAGVVPNGNNRGLFNPATAHGGDPFAPRSAHTVTFTYTDANGCSNSISKDVYVNPRPEVDDELGDVRQIQFAELCLKSPKSAKVVIIDPDKGVEFTDYSNHTFVWTLPQGSLDVVNMDGVVIDETPTNKQKVVGSNSIGFSNESQLFTISVEITNNLTGCSIILSEDERQGFPPAPSFTYVGITADDNDPFDKVDGLDIYFHEDNPQLEFDDPEQGLNYVEFNLFDEKGGTVVHETFDGKVVAQSVIRSDDYDINFDVCSLRIPGLEAGVYETQLIMRTMKGCDIEAETRNITILPVVDNLNPGAAESDLTMDRFYTEDFNDGADGWYVEVSSEDGKSDDRVSSWEIPTPFSPYKPQISIKNFNGDDSDFDITDLMGIRTDADGVDPLDGGGMFVTDWDNAYKEDEVSYVYSPAFDLSEYMIPAISFEHWRDFDSQREGLVIQVSDDDGRNWIELGKDGFSGVNWYTNQGISSGPGETGRYPERANNETAVGFAEGMVTSDGETDSIFWQESRHRVNEGNSRTNLIRFRFALASGGGEKHAENFVKGSNKVTSVSEGFAFDNFEIYEENKVVLVEQFSSMFSETSKRNMFYIAKGNYENSNHLGFAVTPPDHEAIGDTTGVIINYYVDFYNDEETEQVDVLNARNKVDPATRATFYGLLDAPSTRVSGQEVSYDIDTNPEDFGNGFDAISLERPDFLIPDFTFDIDDENVLSGTVNFETNSDMVDERDEVELLFFVAVVEKRIPAISSHQMVGIDDLNSFYTENTDTVYHVLRKLLPGSSGKYYRGELTKNQTFSLDFHWTMTNIYNEEQVRLVAYVQYYNDEFKGNSVEQANFKDVTGKTNVEVGIVDQMAKNGYYVYPNPSDEVLNLKLEEIPGKDVYYKISDQAGRGVKRGIVRRDTKSPSPINTNDLPSGLYIIQLQSEDRKWNPSKIVIMH